MKQRTWMAGAVVAACGMALATAGPAWAGPAAATTTAADQSAGFHLVVTDTIVSGKRHAVFGSLDERGAWSWAQPQQGRLRATMRVGRHVLLHADVLQVGGVQYDRMTGLLATASPGWQETTIQGAPARAGLLSVLDGAVPLEQPSALVARLRSVASSSAVIGRQTILGVRTVHVRSIVPVGRLAAGLRPGQVRRGEQALGSDTVTFDTWLDAQGRLRQLIVVLTSTTPATTTTITTTTGASTTTSTSTIPAQTSIETLILRYFDYGNVVEVQAPPASAVTSKGSCQIGPTGETCSGSDLMPLVAGMAQIGTAQPAPEG